MYRVHYLRVYALSEKFHETSADADFEALAGVTTHAHPPHVNNRLLS